jgi:hypothetical protein
MHTPSRRCPDMLGWQARELNVFRDETRAVATRIASNRDGTRDAQVTRGSN